MAKAVREHRRSREEEERKVQQRLSGTQMGWKMEILLRIFRWLDAGWVSRHDLMHEQEGLKTKIGI